MGYDLHITRRKSWGDGASNNDITEDQWRQFASTFEFGDSEGCFYFNDGCIDTKNPGKATIVKAHVIAAALNAKVQGDDDEVYLPNGEILENHNNDGNIQVVRYPEWLLFLCLFSISCWIAAILEILGYFDF